MARESQAETAGVPEDPKKENQNGQAEETDAQGQSKRLLISKLEAQNKNDI